ncbi:hypothetical protein M947_06245 [Sulfurimonas hongkongensis]|uniref:diguanylate cyclase n=1 Tax=Sulfurimonas hongkongensis TaxID=1172190 RepID=T0JEZ1_9BACT|nr:diguanylate cyclase [Sulfurimonas hongkongensis]EQB39590.1 hypothetical protein M947_06245 [Sulfurimonas hongkongensis]
MDFLNFKKDSLTMSKHQAESSFMREQVGSLILLKQKATVAMALSLANDKNLALKVKNKKIEQDYYKQLIEKLTRETLYKNIWIQLFDKDINTLYRSWSHKRGDNLSNIRADLIRAVEDKKVIYSISAAKFNLSLKAIVPLFIKDEFVGIIEVISHFNSISKELKKSDIDSVVVLGKEYKEQLEEPFTKIFMGDYYVANFDAPKELMKRMQRDGVESYFIKGCKIVDDRIVTSYELKDPDGTLFGHYVMFKKINSLSNLDLDYFMFKWLTFGLVFVMSVAIIVSMMLFFANRRQKEYFHNIIDSSTNIVMVNDTKNIIDVNKIFFKYFSRYKTLQEFKKNHRSISDFFVAEDGYLQEDIGGVNWIKYVVKNPKETHKIKLDIFGKVYCFSVGAAKLLSTSEHYSVILSDITEQEIYKKELELLSITDELTNTGNRRYFERKLKEEISRASRYNYPFSLVMFDIDHFKVVNDKYGHAIGDEVLKEYSKLVNSNLREADVLCRVGGEEFMIILPYTSKDAAKEIAQKLRVAIESHKKVISITMSFGVVEFEEGDDFESIYKRVDDALYSAKRNGRNMVVVQ